MLLKTNKYIKMQSNYFNSLNREELYYNIERYIVNNQVQCILLFAWFVTFLNSVLYNSNQSSKIHQLEDSIVKFVDESKFLTNENQELDSENKKLESKVKSLTQQLDQTLFENATLNNTITKLNERNQTLCESLGDFIKFKKRKLDTDEGTESTHGYNLRNRKNVNYFGQDSNNHEADSDYELTLKK